MSFFFDFWFVIVHFCLNERGFSQSALDPATERRIDDLLQRMTIEEKANNLHSTMAQLRKSGPGEAGCWLFI